MKTFEGIGGEVTVRVVGRTLEFKGFSDNPAPSFLEVFAMPAKRLEEEIVELACAIVEDTGNTDEGCCDEIVAALTAMAEEARGAPR